MCCIKGCPEIASNRKVTCLTGVYELKQSPGFLKQSNSQEINICNHHYYLNTKRGHKPNQPHSKAKHASQTASKTDFHSNKRDDWLTRLMCKTCCYKNKPMPAAYSNSSLKSYMFACNCFDEKSDSKAANRDIYETNSDMYDMYDSKL